MSNVHYHKYAIDGDICGLCDDWWPCPNARESGDYDLIPPTVSPIRKLAERMEENPEYFDPMTPPGGGLLRDPDVVALEKRVEATLEQTDPGENHKELMEMLGGIFIQQSRIYDCLMAMVPDKYRQELDETHENGGLMASPPALREDGWDEMAEGNKE
jgi:hypothetical protein